MHLRRMFLCAAFFACGSIWAGGSSAQQVPLDSVAGLELHNVQVEPVTLEGKRGLRVTFSAEAKQKFRSLSPDDMRARLTRAGFRVISWADRSRDGIEWFDRRKAGRGAAKPSSLGLHVAMGPDFAVMSRNLERNLREGRVGLTEAVLQRS